MNRISGSVIARDRKDRSPGASRERDEAQENGCLGAGTDVELQGRVDSEIVRARPFQSHPSDPEGRVSAVRNRY